MGLNTNLGWRVLTLADDTTHPLNPMARLTPRSVMSPGSVTPVIQQPARLPNDHLAECPLCNRQTAADMFLDVRVIPDALRASLGWSSHDFVCDACRELPHVTGTLTYEQLMTALGAPVAIVADARAHDLVIAAHKPNPNRITLP